MTCGSLLAGCSARLRSAGSLVVRGAQRLGVSKIVSAALAVAFVAVHSGIASATDPTWPSGVAQFLNPVTSLGLLEDLMQYLMPIFLAFSIGVVVCYLLYRWILRFAGGRA